MLVLQLTCFYYPYQVSISCFFTSIRHLASSNFKCAIFIDLTHVFILIKAELFMVDVFLSDSWI